jgi:hypothetical protein
MLHKTTQPDRKECQSTNLYQADNLLKCNSRTALPSQGGIQEASSSLGARGRHTQGDFIKTMQKEKTGTNFFSTTGTSNNNNNLNQLNQQIN